MSAVLSTAMPTAMSTAMTTAMPAVTQDASDAPRTKQPGALARLLEVAPGQRIALPAHTTIDVVEHPVATPVPGAPVHTQGLLSWQGKRIPYIDLDALLRGVPAALAPARYALVVAYQPAPGAAIEHGAIALVALPVSIHVSDSQRCRLGSDRQAQARLALACFEFEGQAIAVLDTARIFR
jgi:chemotaxis signal transduction protein